MRGDVIDLEKRKRVMGRSMSLGHCICDPKKGCPCDVFKEKDVCLCAGEALPTTEGPIRLTKLVEHAGCASKIDQASLKKVLSDLPAVNDPRVLIGSAAGDDAGVYQLDEKTAIVQTVDVFTPSVDDPYTFGEIAAANSVSDIYAMGGRPVTALSILGFPIRTVPDSAMREILRGGLDKMAEAEVAVIGGHSINDPEIKAGFAVTGLIDPAKVTSNNLAKVGDVLILTKPIGTGILAFAAQIDRAKPEWMRAAAESMTRLNKSAAEIMLRNSVHACTDVTGFGLIGHLGNIASASGVDMEIMWDNLPVFPGVPECLAAGIAGGGVERNRESSGGCVIADENVTPNMLDLCFDPQTSGGLLMTVPEKGAETLLRQLKEAGCEEAGVIGRVACKGSGRVHVRSNGSRKIPIKTEEARKVENVEKDVGSPCCCGEAEHADVAGDVQQKFMAFMKSANEPGALDSRTKQAIAIALSILSKCEPCAKIHIKKAREMGFTQAMIDEAAWMAIAFGGSPMMMFYNNIKNM